ncbi:bzip transcription factor [Sporothrix brasiliensis 5110]|uniref:Bzip transcription factor n=1 Tax=Sporothrix brasiliensis 5110 TaxID=1398154 RepID=A0A0C2J6T6_9PEZI|nr:bzip transcription factor [Sporothrix brasiliensis 5110]KIH94660.1 bzip transcription factor [Sporothrix brasiliensis 5110]
MDYTHQFFAGNQPFQHQFIGIPPVTPSHSNSATSDDYATTSPPLYSSIMKDEGEGFHEFANEHFPAFENYGVQFAPQQPIFPGPPTPPGQSISLSAVHGGQQQPPPPQQHAPVTSVPATGPLAPTSAMVIDQDILSTKPDLGMTDDIQQQQEQSRRGGSNSDDDEMTPAQSRRKAQNRAAYVLYVSPLSRNDVLLKEICMLMFTENRQRAFRERKERHVKDLETKLANLEASQNKAVSENEKLKRDLQKVSTENEILRATSSLQAAAAAAGPSPGSDGVGGPILTTGPMTYNPTDFYTDLLSNHDIKTPSHRIATSDSGERLLGAGATWDLIIGHESFKRGLIDVADISNRLKNQAKCDGQGPVFEERAILNAIEQSVGSGSDSLL